MDVVLFGNKKAPRRCASRLWFESFEGGYPSIVPASFVRPDSSHLSGFLNITQSAEISHGYSLSAAHKPSYLPKFPMLVSDKGKITMYQQLPFHSIVAPFALPFSPGKFLNIPSMMLKSTEFMLPQLPELKPRIS